MAFASCSTGACRIYRFRGTPHSHSQGSLAYPGLLPIVPLPHEGQQAPQLGRKILVDAVETGVGAIQ